MKKLPKKLPIGDDVYKVKELKEVFDSDGNAAHAICDLQKKVIEIERDLSFLQKIEFLIHEAGHGVWYDRGLDDEVPSEYAWIEHIIIIGIAKHIVRNRKLYASLLSD